MPDFLGIAGLQAGFDLLAEAGMERLSVHVSALTRMLIEQLRSLRHRNGAPLVKIYGPANTIDRGGTVAFNVCDRDGVPMPYTLVETRARQAGVSLRGGCFCNPGASESAFGLEPVRIGACLADLGATFTPRTFRRVQRHRHRRRPRLVRTGQQPRRHPTRGRRGGFVRVLTRRK